MACECDAEFDIELGYKLGHEGILLDSKGSGHVRY